MYALFFVLVSVLFFVLNILLNVQIVLFLVPIVLFYLKTMTWQTEADVLNMMFSHPLRGTKSKIEIA
jgi:hypothetical protein